MMDWCSITAPVFYILVIKRVKGFCAIRLIGGSAYSVTYLRGQDAYMGGFIEINYK